MGAAELHEIQKLQQFVTKDSSVAFREELEFTSWPDMERIQLQGLFDAFPDYELPCTKLEAGDSSVVILHEIIGSGTHTGAPYACGPCDPIKASGKSVKLDPEYISFHFREDKICKSKFEEKVKFGPPGVYSQLCGFPLM